MSEKTLRQVGDEAAEIRGKSTEQWKKHAESENEAWGAAYRAASLLRREGLEFDPSEIKRREARAGRTMVKAALNALEARQADIAAQEHYNGHKDEYFELGAIDAHLDGVKINVEQPFEIGQKIEVHTPDQQ